MSSESDYYTGFNDRVKTIIIANTDLKAEDINLDLKPASEFRGIQIRQGDMASFLYYKGRKKYLPEVRLQGDMLLIGNAMNARADEKLTLHIRINGLNDIILNGETIWERY
jgi:hypothetical protein